ncbi:MAG: hypothetical protein ACRDZQ_00520 [Acidimicrobiales bacterium]
MSPKGPSPAPQPAGGRPASVPATPRRRAWMLVLVTVVALVPAAIGFGISQLAGGGRAAAAPARGAHKAGPVAPPRATVSAQGVQVALGAGAYTWTSGSRHAVADAAATGPRVAGEPVLRVARGGQVTVRFDTSATPQSVTVGPDRPGAAGQPLPPANPLQFSLARPAGTYAVVVEARWPAGSASYFFRVLVT